MERIKKYQGMKCPECGGKTKTAHAWATDEDAVKRIRVCQECGHKFRTLEYEEDFVRALEGEI